MKRSDTPSATNSKERGGHRPTTFQVVHRVLLEHGRAHATEYAVVLGFMVIVALCTSLSAWIMKDLVNAALGKGDVQSALYFPLIIAGLFLVKGCFSYFQEVGVARIGARIVGDVQRQLYAHLLRMDIAFFQRKSSGDLITRMQNGANAVRDAINLTAVTLGRDLLTVLGLCAVMLMQDPILFFVVLAIVPFAALALRRLSARAKKATKSEAGGMATIVSLTRETSQGVRMLKSFQLERILQNRMNAATADVEARRNKLARIKAAVAPLSEVMSGLAIAAVVLYGSWASQSDPQYIGSLFSFITALLLAGEPLRRLSRLHVDLATAAERISMMYSIFDTPPVEVDDEANLELIVKKGDIRLRDVVFDYAGGKRALNRISLEIPGGKVTALVGPSGGGKTTTLGLLQAFFRPQSGEITVDGMSLREITTSSLRRNIAYLDQEAFLFEGTVEDNIVGSCAVRDRDRAIKAAQMAGADAFVQRMPNGYETPVRELATNLSGGQRQRIGMARAFYKDAPILLLDEPPSALDSATENQIRKALALFSQGRTTVIVAHRLSTVKSADLIHFIADGTVLESGTHSELLALGGHYAAQLRTYLVDDETDVGDDASLVT